MSLAFSLGGERAARVPAEESPSHYRASSGALATFITLVRWRYETTRRIEGLDLGRVRRRCACASRVPGHRPALIIL